MTLRNIIDEVPNDIITAKLIYIINVMTDIFNKVPPPPLNLDLTPEAFFTDHGIGHTNRIIEKIELLISSYGIQLNRYESFIILSSTWLHDIGMFLGGLPDENPILIRDVHAERSVEQIQLLMDLGLLQLEEENLIIKDIVRAHSHSFEINDLTENERIFGNDIRVKFLAAILRLADSCDCDRRRTPISVYKLYFQYIPKISIEHWTRLFSITDINFDRLRSSIVMHINFSDEIQEKIQQHILSYYLQKELESELNSVYNILYKDGIYLRSVEVKIFNTNKYIEFNRFPFTNEYVLMSLKSRFKKIENLSVILCTYLNEDEGLPLIIEIRPPDGPIYINLNKYINIENIENFINDVKEEIGSSFIQVEVITEKIVNGG